MSNTDSPLHIAIRNNNIEIAKLLLAGQCDVHAVNAEGLTPLQLATQIGNAEMITLLFQHGAGDQPKPSPPPMTPKIAIAPGGGRPVEAMPHDVKQRKGRITFWTVFCMASYVLLIGVWFFYSNANDTLQALVEHRATVSEELGLSPQEMEEIIAINRDKAGIAFVILVVVGLPYLYCFNTYMYRLWEEIPTEFARTTPWKASRFSLIPFFNWYWWFVAFVGLYKDMNKATESYSLGTRFDTTWIMAACIFWVGIDPFNAVLALLAEGMGISLFLTNFLVAFLKLLITIPTLWIIQNRVLEFIDIKRSQGH